MWVAQELDVLMRFASIWVAGSLPTELQELLYSGRLVPLNKKNVSGR